MKQAFGTYADAARLLYTAFERNIAEIVPESPLPTVVLELMKWTDREGNLDALISGLFDEFPGVPAVQVLFKFRFPDDPRVLVIRPAPFQPHLPCCPDEGLVLVGRDELQRAIMDRQPNAKNVIVVSGSGRSGKTFSGVVIGVLAPIFKYQPVIINQPANAKPEHVASSILRNVRASDTLPPRNGDPIERWAETLAEWVSIQLRPTSAHAEPWWIVIDGCEHVDADVIAFLERL